MLDDDWCLVLYEGRLPIAASLRYYVSHSRNYPEMGTCMDKNKKIASWRPVARGTRAQMEAYMKLVTGDDDDEES